MGWKELKAQIHNSKKVFTFLAKRLGQVMMATLFGRPFQSAAARGKKELEKVTVRERGRATCR